MKQSGFKLISSDNGITTLQGEFAGFKDCIIGIPTLNNKDLVAIVAIIFPEQKTWSMLSSNYFSLKKLLTEKYGEPSECVEKFESELMASDDNGKMMEVGLDNCKYFTIYEIVKGSIELSIEHNGLISGFVLLKYIDKINGEVVKSQAIDDL